MLFATCVCCGSAFVSIKPHMIGSFLSIKQECSQCNNKFVWESQPYIQNIPAGNLLTSATILYSGSLPSKALRIFKTLNCATKSRKTFFRHQKKYLHPAIHVTWEKNKFLLLIKLYEAWLLVVMEDPIALVTVPSMDHIPCFNRILIKYWIYSLFR